MQDAFCGPTYPTPHSTIFLHNRICDSYIIAHSDVGIATNMQFGILSNAVKLLPMQAKISTGAVSLKVS